MLFDTTKADITELHDVLFTDKQVRVSVLRLDKIHPLVSGNKIFKLHYFLEEALASKHKTLVTFGGAYSNHLAATAYSGKALGLKSIGIVRGEKPTHLTHTLQQCEQDGMILKYISRTDYKKKETAEFINDLKNEVGNCMIIPEGGYHPLGAKGASLIYELLKNKDYTDIALATGTATTLAGILIASKPTQNITGIPVLKGITDSVARLKELTGLDQFDNVHISNEYHFGGYAKRTDALINFMNDCWLNHGLPLDFIYTAKMLYGITDLIKKGKFKKGSNIICLHTGGLQGNKSLPLNLLLF